MKLTKSQQKSIIAHYKDNPLYKAVYKPLKHWENEMRDFHISPEEVFVYVIQELDNIRKSDDPVFDCNALWDTIFADLYENQSQKEADTIRATSIVISVLYTYLLQCTPTYNELCYSLTRQVVAHYPNNEFTTILKALIGNIALFGDERLKYSIIEYVTSNTYLSQEIEIIIDTLEDTTDMEKSKGNGEFSINQLIILAELFLNVPFQYGETNVSAIATLLSKMSGYSENSIRPRIEKFSYDKPKTKEDVRKLIPYLEAINPKLAQTLKNNITE